MPGERTSDQMIAKPISIILGGNAKKIANGRIQHNTDSDAEPGGNQTCNVHQRSAACCREIIAAKACMFLSSSRRQTA